MKLIAKLLGMSLKFRIKEVKIGAKTRFQIQETIFGFVWDSVVNPMISSPASSPYEFKIKSDAEKKISELQSAS